MLDPDPGGLKRTNFKSIGPVAQWITRLTTDQKIAGSNPARIGPFLWFNFLMFQGKNKILKQ